MRRADRLFTIVQLMRGGRRVTARRLAERLEVSERTIYRDIDELTLSGVPIAGEPGRGYNLPATFEIRRCAPGRRLEYSYVEAVTSPPQATRFEEQRVRWSFMRNNIHHMLRSAIVDADDRSSAADAAHRIQTHQRADERKHCGRPALKLRVLVPPNVRRSSRVRVASGRDVENPLRTRAKVADEPTAETRKSQCILCGFTNDSDVP